MTLSAKRTLAAAEGRMAAKSGGMFKMPPAQIKYLLECLDGQHPGEWLSPEQIAAMRKEMWEKV
jgi:hypothetical protein